MIGISNRVDPASWVNWLSSQLNPLKSPRGTYLHFQKCVFHLEDPRGASVAGETMYDYVKCTVGFLKHLVN